MGGVHAVQADGELCVSAIEIPAEVLVRVDLVKGEESGAACGGGP